MSDQQLFQLGELAERLGVQAHRLAYRIKKHGIQPVYQRGPVRLFNGKALNQLQALLTHKETTK